MEDVAAVSVPAGDVQGDQSVKVTGLFREGQGRVGSMSPGMLSWPWHRRSGWSQSRG